jgi:6-phospho-beta-glucosidase
MIKTEREKDHYGIKKRLPLGGATAANQYEGGYLEGGKGLSIADVERGARHGMKRLRG